MRGTLTFATLNEFRDALQGWQSQGRVFVPCADEVAEGQPFVLTVTIQGYPPIDVATTVERPDFDDVGNIGAMVVLNGAGLSALAQPPAGPRAPAPAQAQAPVRDWAEETGATRIRPITQPMPADGAEAGSGAPDAATDPDQLLTPGTVVQDRFRIESHLATGGMGEVYRAAHVHLKRPVALKMLRHSLANDPDMWARFRREAELVSQLESPHVVRVFDFGKTSSGQPFLAMEFVEGQTLDALVASGPLAPERAVQILTQVCDGLAEAHALGVIHRDLKPANIILGKRRGNEIAKILDFGIARLADSSAGHKTQDKLTQMGMVVGTPAYLAPEQALADELDARTDIYSLGCVAYELLTGQPPFVAADVSRVVSMHLTMKPAPLGTVRAELASYEALSAAVDKALAKERSARFQDIQEFARTLAGSIGVVLSSPVEAWGPDPSTGTGERKFPLPSAPPPVKAPTAPAPPPPVAAPPSDDFFSMKATPAGSAAPPAQGKAAAPGAAAPGSPLDGLRKARQQLLTTSRGTLVIVEVLGPQRGSDLLARANAAVWETALAWGAALDALDDDSAVLLFTGEDLASTAGRTGAALVAMREAVAEEATRSAGATASIRAVVVGGSLNTPAGAPVAGDFAQRARTIAARTSAGTIVFDKSVLEALGDAFELKPATVPDAMEFVARRTHLKRTASTMIGRDTFLAAFDKRLTSFMQGVVAPLVVRGRRGIGRTSLAGELANRARQRGVVVGQVRGLEALRGQPLSAVTELICTLCGVPVEQRVARLRPALGALSLPGAAIEGALVVAGVSQLAVTFTPGHVAHVLRSVLRAGSSDRPVLLLFDGLERFDPASVDVFRELVTKPAQKELTVGFATSDLGDDKLGGVPTVELTPFTTAETTTLVQTLIEGTPSARLIEVLQEAAEGVPAAIIDWLWLLDDRGQLRLRNGVVGVVGEPPSLEEEALLAQRLIAMPLEVRRVLEAASVLGDAFEAGSIAAAWPRASAAALQSTVGTRQLRPLASKKWGFASPRYVAALQANPSVERAAMHQRWALALVEQAKVDPSAVETVTLAKLFSAARDGARATALWKHATEQALAARRLRDAMQAMRGWADALGFASEPSPDMLRARVDALARAAGIAMSLQDPPLARILIDQALALAKTLGAPSAEFCLSLARVHRSEARRSKAADTLAEAERLTGTGPLLALIEAERAEARELEGDAAGAVAAYENALTVSEEARELARWHGEIDLTARLQARLAGAYHTKKDMTAARKLYEASLGRWQLVGWPFAEARVLMNLGTLFIHGKEPATAARNFESAAVAAAAAGDIMLQARALLQQAKALKQANQTVASKNAAGDARRLASSIGWDDGKTQAEGLS